MKALIKLPKNPNTDQVICKINQLVDQLNKHKEEIRQLKSKLRINAHYSRV